MQRNKHETSPKLVLIDEKMEGEGIERERGQGREGEGGERG